MRNFSLSHLDSRDLKSSAASYLSHTDVNETYVLAHVAEMDARKMYLVEAYSSMLAYCIQELQMSDDVASKRLRAARTARRFPVLFEAIADSRTSLPSTLFQQQAPGPVGGSDQQAPGPVETQLPRPRVTPLAPQRFALQLTMSQEMNDKLEYAQCLLSHQIPSGDIVQVLDRALDELISKLERRKFAMTTQPRSPRQMLERQPARHSGAREARGGGS